MRMCGHLVWCCWSVGQRNIEGFWAKQYLDTSSPWELYKACLLARGIRKRICVEISGLYMVGSIPSDPERGGKLKEK